MHTKLAFFLPDIAGGISSVLKVLVKQSDTVVLTSNKIFNKKDAHSDYFYDGTVKRFKYDNYENIHHVCRRLSTLLPDSTAIVVANDWLELEMMARLALPNPVLLMVHGDYDYYYQTASIYQSVVNKFICVSEKITQQLKACLPDRVNDISYMPIGVDISAKRSERTVDTLKIIFPARLTEAKGYFDLFKIDTELKKRNITVSWTIAGDTSIIPEISTDSNFTYTGKLAHEQLLETLCSHDVFILPSRNEGFPVSLLEAMKTGLVPLITNFSSGIPEVVVNGQTGFVFEVGDIEGYTDAIEMLYNNLDIYNNMAAAATEKVKNRFTVAQQENVFFSVIRQIDSADSRVSKKKFAAYGSRLDAAIFPNPIVKLIRIARMRIKK